MKKENGNDSPLSINFSSRDRDYIQYPLCVVCESDEAEQVGDDA